MGQVSVATLEEWRQWRSPGCGDHCSPRWHDAISHEEYGRRQAWAEFHANVVATGPLVVNLNTRTATVNGARVDFGASYVPWRMLESLARAGGRAVSRQELCRVLYGHDYDRSRQRTMRSNGHRLRERLGAAGSLIVSVKGVGFRLLMEPPS